MSRLCEQAPDAALRDRFVTVHDAGRFPEGGALAGHPYLVMELVRGGSVKGALRAGAFPLGRTIHYWTQVLEALAFMHDDSSGRRASIHRDIKPANVLISRRDGARDQVKISDFGLALEVDALLGWAETGGDLGYLAPESFDRNICSPQSDVYMMGLLFYEMLTGRNPFDGVGAGLRGGAAGDRAELRKLHYAARERESFPLLETDVELKRRPALAAVIRTALASDLQARTYRNATELSAAWRAALDGTEGPEPADERPWSKVARLTREAESYLALGARSEAYERLALALSLNRDRSRVPDAEAVGRTYLLEVERLVALGDARSLERALMTAHEGYARRRCRSTCLACLRAFESQRPPSPAAARYATFANECEDQA
jgi:serine/threonine protein kinase